MWHDIWPFALGAYIGGVIAFMSVFIESVWPGVTTRGEAIISCLKILVWPVWFTLYASYMVVMAIVKARRLAQFGRRW